MPKYRRWAPLLLLAFVVAAPSAVTLSYLRDAFRPPVTFEGKLGSPFLAPGIRMPDVVPADRAELPDGEMVIGVDAGSRPRAYRVAAMAPMVNHVVNDLIAGQPFTITYCNRTNCVRVFTGSGDVPLPVEIGGFMEQMMLRYDGRFFFQDTAEYVDPEAARIEGGPPMQVVRHALTTWAAWRKDHPDTEVFVGDVPIAKP